MDPNDARLIFANRLRHARQQAELTQEALGVAIGLAPEVARTRINRYEKGVNECDLRTAKRLASELDMPLAALYAETPEIADAITALTKLSVDEQRKESLRLQRKARPKKPASAGARKRGNQK
ncbi:MULTISPECIES: helix-turn-helix transcriptional regulator [Xanthomonas]|uniref:helix-turn-helix transcriptional regulator n=1 Tax=Xanthomonas TaxID=338 RepID=UPI0003B036F9|nr:MULTISPECIES: helix-turn-helix transcriptional regulator [Xanthomonas]ATS64258.1 helix-turn-helix transcriptional regulator [Xanthomonas citri pv. phaseoli var. fuscans]ATS70677.1 helix-turn-helix transcriptional regulator [Xanthomonas citri pv. phaseoli var. fuscans]ATS79636.1 helix-turn-helix transcriptional regulator [Xanthomonas citri pv. phaseoli var. fuscans]KGP21967.1 DNA-binding protein [Xanthomonas phaseoli pv. phaseoli]KGP22758.1 DNA-binding protein [Xanthomonas citri pv. fuscans]